MVRMSMREIEAAFAGLGISDESERRRLRSLATLGDEHTSSCLLSARSTDDSSIGPSRNGDDGDAYLA